MTKRTLMITMTANWRGALRSAGKRATARGYQGEVLNFDSAGSFFGRLTERRWVLVHALQGRGPMSVRNWHAEWRATSGAFMMMWKGWPSWISSSAPGAAQSIAVLTPCISTCG